MRWSHGLRCLLVAVLLTYLLIAWTLPWELGAQATTCAAFDSQVWAQSVFVTDPVAYAALDPDGDGRACADLPSGAAPAWWTSEVPPSAEPVTLTRVVDGDTIRVFRNGVEEPVRLILIDTPETSGPNGPAECYGAEASAFLTWLLSLGGQLYLETDVSDRDQYGRLLRYVWLDFGDGEVYLVNEAMVRSGYAALSTYPPDVKYVEQIRDANTFAREHGYGLWSDCVTDSEGDTQELTAAADTITEDAAPAGGQGMGIVADPVEAFGCDPSYPDVCIPPAPPDLDCGDIPHRRFTVLAPDPHNFDGDFDGVGCERD